MRANRRKLKGTPKAEPLSLSENRQSPRKAIFLDRDGTLNQDLGYVHKNADWIWLPEVLEALKMFRDAGWLLVVISNQSGVGRKLFRLEDLKNLESYVDEELKSHNIVISGWYDCIHVPEAGCGCRKPAPGLIFDAVRDLTIDSALSWMIGDRIKDVEAGMAAGCRTGLIKNFKYPEDAIIAKTMYPHIQIWDSLLESAQYICRKN